MIENNPEKIKKAEIVVGVPSFNEADNIAFVTKQVDEGLEKYFSQKAAVIINNDNDSPDNTGGVFLKTKTRTPKIYISTPKGIQGKGNNLKNLFLKVKDLKATAIMTVDADLKSITPEWAKCLLEPIIKGCDFVTPVYHRHKYDGSITNHLVYPLIYGLLGYDIRQPIGGDMAFSKRMADYWLKQEWSATAKSYGVDIFMTFNAIKSGFKLAQVNLGSKIHKSSLLKLDKMFLEVAETLFNFLSNNKNLWQRKINLKTSPLSCQTNDEAKFQNFLPVDYRVIERIAISAFLEDYEFIKEGISLELRKPLEKMFLQEKSLEID
ncbi:MAG: glycosyltransferase, partial [Candidatus Portnoybacteria bacterium]|nr:glycosyltransferase [Candidatus Portnoybacteria bacterium]